MQFAIFGISNDGLSLAVNLFLLMLVAIYFASIAYTYMDARRRIDDPVLVVCATVASLIPFIGAAVYMMLRPPEFLDDARERQLEMRAAELRVRQLSELACPNCSYPVEKSYLRCPNCQRRLKDPCQSCGKPVDPRWALCPYCENALPGRTRKPRGEGRPGPPEARTRSSRPPKERAEPEPEQPAGEKRSARRGRREGSPGEPAPPEQRPARAKAPARRPSSRAKQPPPEQEQPPPEQAPAAPERVAPAPERKPPPPEADGGDGEPRTRQRPARGRSDR